MRIHGLSRFRGSVAKYVVHCTTAAARGGTALGVAEGGAGIITSKGQRLASRLPMTGYNFAVRVES